MSGESDEQGRPEPPLDGDEWQTLTGFLDFLRATIAWKTAGLDAAQWAQPLPPSGLTLGGVLKHLAYVEDDWFGRWLFDRPRGEPWAGVDWADDPDWEWRTGAADPPDDVRRLWTAAVERSRAAARRALDDGGLSRPADRRWPDGRAPSLRWILTHMIEEYARHTGHVDLVRESVDGLTGE